LSYDGSNQFDERSCILDLACWDRSAPPLQVTTHLTCLCVRRLSNQDQAPRLTFVLDRDLILRTRSGVGYRLGLRHIAIHDPSYLVRYVCLPNLVCVFCVSSQVWTLLDSAYQTRFAPRLGSEPHQTWLDVLLSNQACITRDLRSHFIAAGCPTPTKHVSSRWRADLR